MYQGADDPRSARRLLDTPAGFSPEATARTVLARIRKLLEAYTPGMSLERVRSREELAKPLSDPDLERERLFALGWLHWLNDEPAAAETLLTEAMNCAREQNALPALAESAYWRARVRLLRSQPDSIGEFESVLRTLGGSPRATAWFVDLLWRAGRIERAEQVWKSVRGNRRVSGCAEGPLLEARSLLRRGEMAPAERLLAEARPDSVVVEVERLLLLAWIAGSRNQYDEARDWLRQAREGLYPAVALRTWTVTLEKRFRGEVPTEEGMQSVPSSLREFLKGQRARLQGREEEAVAAYRTALDSPARPFAHYSLACLGQEDFAAVLASQPGWFLGVRCRVRLAIERFRRGEASPAEYLDALRQAVDAGYQDAAADHFGRLATALQEQQPDVASLRELAADPLADASARNAFRGALAITVRRLPLIEARELLLEWSQRDDLNDELRVLVGRQLLRLLLAEKSDEAMHSAVARLLPGEPLLALVNQPAPQAGNPAIQLWQAARTLDQASSDPERWREEVRELRSHSRWKGLAQALLLQEAAQRSDVAAVLERLEEMDFWRGLQTAPRFVLLSLEMLLAAQPGHPGCRRVLTRWLPLWEPVSLGTHGTNLAAHAGLAPPSAETAQPPQNTPAVPWFLHQAAMAIRREDSVAALAFTRRACALDPDLSTLTQASVVREALPEMERRARAQRLALALQPEGDETLPRPAPLVGAVEALGTVPEGTAILDALANGDRTESRDRIEALCDRPSLPPRLAHHLALLMLRAARALEGREQTENAISSWWRSWQCWLRFFATSEPDARPIVLDWLLGLHRHRLNDLLARRAVDAARLYWNLVRELPERVSSTDEALGRILSERVERFADELATEYLLTTREAMRYGDIMEGFRADYEKGSGYLRRLLSLDHDNVRLLAALVEICNDWFLDLYRLGQWTELRTQLERFTPFALQLARRCEERSSDLSARVALSDYWKFRGFLAADPEHKTALYREALRFNPANHNVRDLLAELEAPRRGPEDHTVDVG